jgi:transcription initiation factor TFIID subunit 2
MNNKRIELILTRRQAIQYFKTIRETRLVSTILLRTLMDRRYYYGIRVEAAYGLARCATKELDNIGLFHLMKAFQYFFCNGESGIPRGNDFQNFMQYYVQKAIPSAISNVRNESGSAPLKAQRFLLDLLKYNDNANNAYTDAFYIAGLIHALGNTLISTDYAADVYNLDYDPDEAQELRAQILEEIERHQRLDAWLPGYHNIVTQAALQAKMRLVRAGTLQKNLKELLIYSKEGTNELLRLCAFQALLGDNGLHNPHLVKYLLGVIGKDPANYMRYNILRLLVRAIGAAAVTVKEDDGAFIDHDEMIIETENNDRMNARQAQLARETVLGAWDNLRKELGGMIELQKGIWSAVQ